MQANASVGAFGSYDDKPASLRATSLYANLRHHYVHQRGNPDATTFWSGIGLMRRDIFLQFGGFDWERFPYPSVEDVELGMRVVAAGHRIRLVPSALGKHCKDWSLWRVWHTDVLRRARPWSLLLSERPGATKDLNLAKEERAKAFLALMIPTLLAGGLFSSVFLLLAAVTALLYGFVNRGFFSFLFRRLPMSGLRGRGGDALVLPLLFGADLRLDNGAASPGARDGRGSWGKPRGRPAARNLGPKFISG